MALSLVDNRDNKARKGSEKIRKEKSRQVKKSLETSIIFFIIVLAGIFCFPSIKTLFADHPPEIIVTEYTHESELNPNEFIKWNYLENEMRENYTWRVIQKDDQIILLRFYTGTLSGYAYYLNDQLYIYANGDSGRTHFMKDSVTPAKKRAVDSWLDKHRKAKVSFINSSHPFAVLGLVKFVVRDGEFVDYIVLSEKWREHIKILLLGFGTYGLTKYDPALDKILGYRTFKVKQQGIIIEM